MSKKISDFFTSIPKKRKIKNDDEAGGNAKKTKIDQLKIQDCKVVLVDIMRDTKSVNSANLTSTESPKAKSNVSKDKGKKPFSKPSLECKVCGKTFKSNGGIWHHNKNAHNSHGEKFECDFCGQKTSLKGNILLHMSVHLPPVKCPICHIEMKKFSLGIHLKNYHTGEKNFTCSTCSASFKTKSILISHERTHNKKLECENCNRKYSLQCDLNRHLSEVHENPGSFACDKCRKRFNRKSDMKKHRLIHDRSRPKPFKCHKCSYSTDSKKENERHQKVHQRQEEKFAAMKNPVKCEKCEKFCRDKKTLKRHMKAVHLPEKFQCDLCGNYYTAMSSLKCHINDQHMLRLGK